MPKKVARQAGLEIDFVRKKNFRKEQKSEQILQQRGYHPGLVWVFSALELCTTYAPQYNPDRKPSHRSAKDQKCLHYYFYFIDEVCGLCYLRVPTGCPFRLPFYGNLPNGLARQLDAAGIPNRLRDNAFVQSGDGDPAQQIGDRFEVKLLHERLDQWVDVYGPSLRQLQENYNGTLDTAAYATDGVFQRQQDLQPTLASVDAHRGAHGKAARHRHILEQEAERQLPRRDGESL